MLAVYIRLLVCIALPTSLMGQGYFYTKPLYDSAFIEKKQVVILSETDNFVIITTNNILIETLNRTALTGNEADAALLNQLKQQKAPKLFADSFLQLSSQLARLQLHTARLLQNGNCLVFNKGKQQLEKNITIEKYWINEQKGLRFKSSDGNLFFETTESD